MGPWTHGGHGMSGIGAPLQGDLSYPGAVGWSDSLALLHFDYYMRSISNGWNTTPYIQYFQMGDNVWQNTATWPPAGVSNQTLYFKNDNSITATLPSDTGLFKSITYDPRDPSPTIGGSTLRADLLQGPYDQAPLVESRNDIVSFTSAPFISNVIMKGKSTVHLFVSSNRKDTDFSIRLTDVYPDNRSELVSDGIRRLRFRTGFTAADTSSIVAGQVVEAIIDLPDVALTFIAGHRLRVDVTSSNYPRFDCNLNNGLTMYTAGDTLIANNKMFVSSNHASYIVLPLNGFFIGMDENVMDNSSGIKVYPNPAKDMLYISLPENMKDEISLNLYDSYGKTVMNCIVNDISRNGNTIQLNISKLPSGIYSLSVKGNNGTFAKKIIISK